MNGSGPDELVQDTDRRLPRLIGGNTLALAGLSISGVLFEYVLATVSSSTDFENYVTVRNLLLVSAAIGPLGVNELIIRRLGRGDTRIWSLMVMGVLSALGWSMILTLPNPWVDGLPPFEAFLLPLTAFTFAAQRPIGAVFRGMRRHVPALILRDGWRLAAWLTFLASALAASHAAAFLIVTTIVAALAFLAGGFWMLRPKLSGLPALTLGATTRDLDLKTTLSFWLAMVTLVSLSYLDQLVLDVVATDTGELRTYALAVALIVTPFSLVSVSIGMIMVPELAAGSTYRGALGRFLPKDFTSVMLLLFGTVCVLSLGFWPVSALLSLTDASLDPLLYTLLCLGGLLRLAFVVPSSLMAARAGPRSINVITFGSLVFALLQIPIALALYPHLGLSGFALGATTAWVARCWLGYTVLVWRAA